jgi:Zinc knuckle
LDCKNPRKIDRSHIPDVAAEDAWTELKAASDERDLDDIKEAALKYIKATPDATYFQLENAFRAQGMNIYLIGMEKELAMTYTNMDLQGNLDKKYSVSWRLSPHHQRPKEKDAWPATPEDNLARLQDAGEPVDRGIPKCSNCDTLGHTKRNCPEEKQEITDRAEVKCFNCEAIGMTLSPLANIKADSL